MSEQNSDEHVMARQAFMEIIGRAGSATIRQALAGAVEEQERGNAGLFFTDEDMGHPPNYILAIRGGVAYLEVRDYFRLPISEIVEMLPTESVETNPE